ncbi:MAG: hypothetical protein ACE5G7_06005 [Candidatus Hydrothermarchaeaceae archaeon]
MNKIFVAFVLLLFTAQVISAAELDRSVYDIINDKKGAVNRFVDEGGVPAGFGGLTSARINLIVGDEEVGIIIKNGRIADVVKGGIDNPTNEFKTTRNYFKSILVSDNPLKRFNYGLRYAFIMRRDHGIGGRAKGKLVERALQKLDKPEPKREKKVSRRLGEMARKETASFQFEVEGANLGMERTDLALTTEEDVSDKTVTLEEYSGYVDTAPSGLTKLTLGSGEGSLGTYLKVEMPGIDTKEVLLKVSYKDEELDYKFLDENSLAIKWFDEDSGQWRELREGDPAWVKEVGVNKEENYVFAKLDHASVYGVSGTIIDLKKIEEQRDIEPVYFESKEEVEKVRAGSERKGIIDRIIDFVLGLFL